MQVKSKGSCFTLQLLGRLPEETSDRHQDQCRRWSMAEGQKPPY